VPPTSVRTRCRRTTQRLLTIVRDAAGPVTVRTVGEVLGLPVEVRGKLEPLRAKLNRLADRAWLRKLADGRFMIAL
jgi:predicted transcriptional regulator of viral defense system